MSQSTLGEANVFSAKVSPDSGLACLSAIATYYRIPSDPVFLASQMGLSDCISDTDDILRAAKLLGLKARIVDIKTPKRIESIPGPIIVRSNSGSFMVVAGISVEKLYRLVDPIVRRTIEIPLEELLNDIQPFMIQISRRPGGDGVNPKAFGFHWFLQSIQRYHKPLTHVLIISLFLQITALITPLFFQVIVDKVLPHKGYSTLLVLISGLFIVGIFEVLLQYLRTYALSHTTNRIDVELGQRLFNHLLRLPLSFFETRSAGQTVERVREIEKVRQFMTGQALFAFLDFIFIFIFFGVLWAYSWKLTMVVLASVPFYFIIGALISPSLRELVKSKFNYGALSQQFLIENVIGIHTIKSAAVEPLMQVQWEDRLSNYVRSSFKTTLLASVGQNAIQWISKLATATILLFGAKSVIDGELSVGELVAFNMIAGQVAQPILRMSQIWQDFQQVRISIDRLGDILNSPVEYAPTARVVPQGVKGAIEFRNVSFRYRADGALALKGLSMTVRPGQVVGIVGPSGSGKSTLAKLLQRLYTPEQGQIFLDGADISQLDPAWLRRNIGIVLQENLLFNRSIHENITFANPTLDRTKVISVAQLSGADEFINKLPMGYDTVIEERGSNLSGGQRQRIAIARALATNPRILVFDEATSALDYESERIIQQNMQHIVKNRTVIIIAHRLAAMRGCENIIGIVDGTVVEYGTHDQLLQKSDGLYARLWKLQSIQAMS